MNKSICNQLFKIMCKKKHYNYIKWMVDNCDDLDVNIVIEHGETAIVCSYAYYDDLNLFQILINHPQIDVNTIFHSQLYVNDEEYLELCYKSQNIINRNKYYINNLFMYCCNFTILDKIIEYYPLVSFNLNENISFKGNILDIILYNYINIVEARQALLKILQILFDDPRIEMKKSKLDKFFKKYNDEVLNSIFANHPRTYNIKLHKHFINDKTYILDLKYYNKNKFLFACADGRIFLDSTLKKRKYIIKLKQNNFNYNNIVIFSEAKLLCALHNAILNNHKFKGIIIQPYN